MPFCPSCRCEYRTGGARCSDCDTELVESLSPPEGEGLNRGKLDLVFLGSFPDPMEAQMFQELLESNGILSILQSDFNAGLGTYTSSPNALLVQDVDLPKSRELYEQYFAGEPSEIMELGPDDQEKDS